MRMGRSLCRAWWLGLLLLSSCGPSLHGRVYQGQGLKFEVGETPATWRRIDAEGTLLAYRDDDLEATAAVNGRCGKDAEDVPLAALTQHLFLLFTERKIQEQRVVSLDAREALRTSLSAKLDGVRKSFVIYVLKKDGCVFDFLYISRPETFSSGVASFERFVEGFRSLSSALGGD